MELHLLRLVFSTFVIIWSVVIFIAVGAKSLKKKDPAVGYIRLPFLSEMVYTILELVFLFLSVTETQTMENTSLLNEYARAVRLSMGILTYIFCFNHYRANGISTDRLIPIKLAIFITAVNYLIFSFGLIFPSVQSLITIITTVVLSATFLYTGVMAVLAAIEKKDFYLSSRAGFWGAVFCLSYYPFVGTADALLLTVPLLDSNRSVAIQLHPIIFFVILTISTVFIFRIKKSDERDYRKPVQALSERERAVAALMRTGQSNKQIAQELGISLATVKTHAANVLKKFLISSRADLPFITEEEEVLQ